MSYGKRAAECDGTGTVNSGKRWVCCFACFVFCVWLFLPLNCHASTMSVSAASIKREFRTDFQRRHFSDKAAKQWNRSSLPSSTEVCFPWRRDKSKKTVPEKELPECLFASGPQYWQNSDSPSFSVLWNMHVCWQDFCFLSWIWVSFFFLAGGLRCLPTNRRGSIIWWLHSSRIQMESEGVKGRTCIPTIFTTGLEWISPNYSLNSF